MSGQESGVKNPGAVLERLDRIESMLEQIMAQGAVNKTGWPVHAPTIDDEMAAVNAQGGDLLVYLQKRSREHRAKKRSRK